MGLIIFVQQLELVLGQTFGMRLKRDSRFGKLLSFLVPQRASLGSSLLEISLGLLEDCLLFW